MISTNVIYNEDCLIGMEKLEDKSVDLILTDLPYGVTAAMNTNRKYIGFEIDENYYNITKERIEEYGKK